ncbi:MAG: aminotransferase class V-fold PLP-dependent enzyme [Woeseiaceae bacterium]|nr:aminotransferase class V-fold PLP-dependent enzyme [Woeseiaceae bacterium]
MTTLEPQYLRDQLVGIDSMISTPFGERLMVYCDYTASGRCLKFIESYLQSLQRVYANTHTEDDITGRSMSQFLHDAEQTIKDSVNAGPDGCIIACGSGATAAIHKLQQIIGVAIAPASWQTTRQILDAAGIDVESDAFQQAVREVQPIVFVGPYEHHSNELSWRHSLAETIEVRLGADGHIDLGHLRELLQDPRYQDRMRIGSFSAASNVTGLISDVYSIACLLHEHDALACFDYAASAPYVEIDMNPNPRSPGDDPSLDAIFVSPHKFVGGPGSSGVLIFNKRIYDTSLPPTVSGGGTVDYVGLTDEDFIKDIEEREKAGTPGVLQTLKAALAFNVKDRVGVEVITSREHAFTTKAIGRWEEHDCIELLGDTDPSARTGIISFNIRRPEGGYLHHKFVTALLNDLFGIQSRAGCSCAGPYGHRLLDIGEEMSSRYRDAVSEGHCGMKPGWCRVGLHWVMDDIETDYVIEAVFFVASHGRRFLELYDFDLETGTWTHRQAVDDLPRFSLDEALSDPACAATAMPTEARRNLYQQHLADAHRWLDKVPEAASECPSLSDKNLADLQFFALPADAKGL